MGKSTTKVIRFQIILYRKYSNDWALGLSSAFPVPPLLHLVSSHKAAARLGRHGSWMDDGQARSYRLLRRISTDKTLQQ